VGLTWLTAVDFWLFMDRHKQKIRRQVPMFSQPVMIEQLDKLRKLRKQEPWTGSQELHKELVMLNTGDHSLLAAVDYAGNRIVLMDLYGVEKDLGPVLQVRNILVGANWSVCLRKMGCQQAEDGNSCGYHVLQWIWQLANSRNLEAEDWVPARCDMSQWIIKVQKVLGISEKVEIQRKKMARRGPVRYRRWKREQYRLKRDEDMSWDSGVKQAPKKSDSKLKRSNMRGASRAKKEMTFYSNNMNGDLAHPEKLRQIVKWINNVEPTALLLQETHMTLQEEKKGWVQKVLDIEAPGYQIYCAGTDDEKVKGVAVIVSKTLVPFVKKDQIIVERRLGI